MARGLARDHCIVSMDPVLIEEIEAALDNDKGNEDDCKSLHSMNGRCGAGDEAFRSKLISSRETRPEVARRTGAVDPLVAKTQRLLIKNVTLKPDFRRQRGPDFQWATG